MPAAFGRYPLLPMKIQNFTPGPYFVVVQEQLRPDNLRSGASSLILINQPVTTHGIVLKVGAKAEAEHDLHPGDHVVYKAWHGGRWAFENPEVVGGQTHCLIMDVAYIGIKYIPDSTW